MAQDHRRMATGFRQTPHILYVLLVVNIMTHHPSTDTADRFMIGSSHHTRNPIGIFLEMKNSTTTCRWYKFIQSMSSGSSRATFTL
jgi:hypothetical protein